MSELNVFFAYQMTDGGLARAERESLIDQAVRTVNDDLHSLGYEAIVRWDLLELKSGSTVGGQVLDAILRSDLFFADLSRLNSNVLFELGYALACRHFRSRPVVVLMSSTDLDLRELPSDFLGQYLERYENVDYGRMIARVLLREARAWCEAGNKGGTSMALRDYWHPGDGAQYDLVASEIPVEERPPYADPDHPNYLRYAKFADLDSLVAIHERLPLVLPGVRMRLIAPSEYHGGGDKLITVGGAGWNTTVRSLQRYLPAQYEVDDSSEWDLLTVSAGGEEFRFAPYFGPDGTLHHDYSIAVRLRVGVNGVTHMLGGGLTTGVLGAVLTFTGESVMETNIRWLTEHADVTGDLVLVLATDRIGDFVRPPDFLTSPPCLVLQRPHPGGTWQVAFVGDKCPTHHTHADH